MRFAYYHIERISAPRLSHLVKELICFCSPFKLTRGSPIFAIDQNTGDIYLSDTYQIYTMEFAPDSSGVTDGSYGDSELWLGGMNEATDGSVDGFQPNTAFYSISM